MARGYSKSSLQDREAALKACQDGLKVRVTSQLYPSLSQATIRNLAKSNDPTLKKKGNKDSVDEDGIQELVEQLQSDPNMNDRTFR
jgi:hypothetical protein